MAKNWKQRVGEGALLAGMAFGGAGCGDDQQKVAPTEQVDPQVDEIIARLIPTIREMGRYDLREYDAKQERKILEECEAGDAAAKAYLEFSELQKQHFNNQPDSVKQAILKRLGEIIDEEHRSGADLDLQVGLEQARWILENSRARESVKSAAIDSNASAASEPLVTNSSLADEVIKQLDQNIREMADHYRFVCGNEPDATPEEKQAFLVAKERLASALKKRVDLEPLAVRWSVADNLRRDASADGEQYIPGERKMAMHLAADILYEHLKNQAQGQGRGR